VGTLAHYRRDPRTVLRACYVAPTAVRRGVGSAVVAEIERIACEQIMKFDWWPRSMVNSWGANADGHRIETLRRMTMRPKEAEPAQLCVRRSDWNAPVNVPMAVRQGFEPWVQVLARTTV
jgi:hypothetical protein